MTKVGILVHCRHLNTTAWEDLVFGRTEDNTLGDHGTLARVLLTLEPTEELVGTVIGRGPSYRDGLDEGEYSKQYMLSNFDRLRDFDTLKPLFAKRSDEEIEAVQTAIENIIITPEIKNTKHEVAVAADILTQLGAEKVIQICAASHASRCIKEQAAARANGLIGKSQIWQTMATDRCYDGARPEDVCIIEPLHRKDQPMTHVRPWLSEAMIPYIYLNDEDKKKFINMVSEFMASKNYLP
jgi:hypothetical protein